MQTQLAQQSLLHFALLLPSPVAGRRSVPGARLAPYGFAPYGLARYGLGLAQQTLHNKVCTTKLAQESLHYKACTTKLAQRSLHNKASTKKLAQQSLHNKACTTKNAQTKLFGVHALDSYMYIYIGMCKAR